MIKELDDLYYYLGSLEETYGIDISNPQECLAIYEARLKLEAAISDVAVLITQWMLQQEGPEKRLC